MHAVDDVRLIMCMFWGYITHVFFLRMYDMLLHCINSLVSWNYAGCGVFDLSAALRKA